MTTRLRSACDRCHQTKVRCSGDIPCQGCLSSKSMCFYSVSNPLGRPKGTKNGTSRARPRGNSTWQKDSSSSEEQSSTTRPVAARHSRKRSSIYQSQTNSKDSVLDSDSTEPQSSVASSSSQDDYFDLSRSTAPSSRNSVSYSSAYAERHGLGMLGFKSPDDIRLNTYFPSDAANHNMEDISPYSMSTLDFSRLGTPSDVVMSNFADFADAANARVPPSLEWDGAVYPPDMGHAEFLWTSLDMFDANNPNNFQTKPQQPDNYDAMYGEQIQPYMGPTFPVTTQDVGNFADSINQILQQGSQANSCSCLQQHAELLCNPKYSDILAHNDPDQAAMTIEKALSVTEQGMKVWNNLINCPNCPYSNDQEVVLLTYTCLRVIIRYLQHLAPRYATKSPKGSKHYESSPQQLICDDTRITVGSFEVEGEDRLLVSKTLFQSTLKKVKMMLRSLQAIQDKKKKMLLQETSNRAVGADDYQTSSNMFHVQQISQKLISSIHTLELSLSGE